MRPGINMCRLLVISYTIINNSKAYIKGSDIMYYTVLSLTQTESMLYDYSEEELGKNRLSLLKTTEV